MAGLRDFQSLVFHVPKLLYPIVLWPPSVLGCPRYRGFTITLRHTKVGRTPLDE
jgi:hypothetical protein